MNGVETLSDALGLNMEWLLVGTGGRSFPVTSREISISVDPRGALFGYVDVSGGRLRRLRGVRPAENGYELDLAGPFGIEAETVRLVRRTRAAELAAEIERSRESLANQCSELFADAHPGSRVLSVRLDPPGGRIALFEISGTPTGRRAGIADVTGTIDPASLLASAMLTSERLAARRRFPIGRISILVEERIAARISRLHALLSAPWRDRIELKTIDRRAERCRLTRLEPRSLASLWTDKNDCFDMPPAQRRSRTSLAIASMAPDAIDIITSRRGETLRFNGLPFARVRMIGGREAAWFGIGRSSAMLDAGSMRGLRELISELASYRCAESADRRHSFFRSSPESWLESLVQRDVSALDPNLILSPVYHQFRAAGERLDLLALRGDGRLIVIELKAGPDRRAVFQAAEYWRRIELQRRRGDLARANLFGGREIADMPAAVYLAGPAWSFSEDVELFSRALTPEIELWRFELHQDWRRSIRVTGRRCAGDRDSY